VGKEYRKSKGLASVSEVDLSELERLSVEEHPLDLVARVGAQMLLEAAIEAEAALGRSRYERLGEDRQGYRNGVRTRRLTSGVGELELNVPRVCGTGEPFRSQVLPAYTRILPKVTQILPALYVEGLSPRDFKRALGSSLGKAGLSKSSISRACRKLKAEFAAWRERSLDSIDLLYLFLDGFYVGVRKGSKEKEGILVAHGYCVDGSRVLIAIDMRYRESTVSWKSFLQELVSRGLRMPKLVVCDGNPGLLRAVGEVWPEVAIQRCIAHRIRNILDRVFKAHRESVKKSLREIFYADDEAAARRMADAFVEKWGREFAAATRCLLEQLDACLTFYRFPSEHWKRKGGTESVEWRSPVKTVVHLRLPVRAKSIDRVLVDGAGAEYRVEPGCGLTWVEVETLAGTKGSITVFYKPGGVRIPDESTVKQGDELKVSLPDDAITGWSDPQGILNGARLEDGMLKGIVGCEPGPALLFLSVGGRECPSLAPVRLRVEPKTSARPQKVWSAPRAPDKDLQPWIQVDLKSTFNASVTEVLQHVADSAQPPQSPASEVGFGYWKDHLIARCLSTSQPPSDAAWRKKVGPDGIAWTTDRIPFKTSKEGPNIGVVTLAGGYPAKLEFPVNASGKELYLMISGMTFPVQSHVVNLRVTLRYADGQTDRHDLVNPFGIGDCWGVWCGRWHNTAANGFENIGGRFGPAGSSEVQDMTKPISVDTEAHLVPFELRQGIELRSVEIEAVANDVIFGVMLPDLNVVKEPVLRVRQWRVINDFACGPVGTFPVGALHLTTLVKPERTDVLQSIFSDKRFNGGVGVAALYLLPGGKLQGQVHFTSDWEKVESTSPLSTGKWYKVELTYDLRELKLYVDGRLEGTRDVPATEIPISAHPVIGAEEKFSDDFWNHFKGSIAYVKVEAYTE